MYVIYTTSKDPLYCIYHLTLPFQNSYLEKTIKDLKIDKNKPTTKAGDMGPLIYFVSPKYTNKPTEGVI